MVVNLAKCFPYTGQGRWYFQLPNADRYLFNSLSLLNPRDSNSFRSIPIHSDPFWPIPAVHSGIIPVHSGPFRYHSGPFRAAPPHSTSFRSVPAFSNARCRK